MGKSGPLCKKGGQEAFLQRTGISFGLGKGKVLGILGRGEGMWVGTEIIEAVSILWYDRYTDWR